MVSGKFECFQDGIMYENCIFRKIQPRRLSLEVNKFNILMFLCEYRNIMRFCSVLEIKLLLGKNVVNYIYVPAENTGHESEAVNFISEGSELHLSFTF